MFYTFMSFDVVCTNNDHAGYTTNHNSKLPIIIKIK